MHDAYEAWNARDLDRFASYFTDDALYVTSGLFPGIDETYRGPDGMRRFHADMLSAWDSFRLEPLEIHEDSGFLLAPIRFHGRGRSSGVEVTLDFHHVAVVESEKVRFIAAGPTPEAALATAAEHGVTPESVT